MSRPVSTPASERLRHEGRHFDRLAEEIGNAWWGHRTPAGQARIRRRAAVAAEFAGLRPGVRVLEPGAGAGEFTESLVATGATVCTVDVSAGQVGLARGRLGAPPNLRMGVGDAGRLAFRPDRFDAIVGLSVLHHLDIETAFREFFRVLRPGGRMFFSEPNMLNPQVFLERHVKWFGRSLQNSPDETAFVRWTIGRRLADHGFCDVRVVPVDFLHPGVPGRAVGLMERVGAMLERLPLLREIAGSLFIFARKR